MRERYHDDGFPVVSRFCLAAGCRYPRGDTAVSATLHVVDAPSGGLNSQVFQDDPGAMFRWPAFDRDGRECWCIALPNKAGLWWTTYEADGSGEMWDVTGEVPNITVSPSINAGDGPGLRNWHGWIKDGVMTP